MSDEMITETKFFESPVDGTKQRYIIEYPECLSAELLVVYLHSGIHPAEQGFKRSAEWGFAPVGDETAARGGVYISPDYRGDSWFNEAAETDILYLINRAAESFGTKKLILVGTSMGGGAALAFAEGHSGMVDGVIAIAPALNILDVYRENEAAPDYFNRSIVRTIVRAYGGTPEEKGESYYVSRSAEGHPGNLTMPLVILQCDGDKTLSVEDTRRFVCDALDRGVNVLYDEIPFATHDTVTANIPWKEYFDFVIGEK